MTTKPVKYRVIQFERRRDQFDYHSREAGMLREQKMKQWRVNRAGYVVNAKVKAPIPQPGPPASLGPSDPDRPSSTLDVRYTTVPVKPWQPQPTTELVVYKGDKASVVFCDYLKMDRSSQAVRRVISWVPGASWIRDSFFSIDVDVQDAVASVILNGETLLTTDVSKHADVPCDRSIRNGVNELALVVEGPGTATFSSRLSLWFQGEAPQVAV